MHRWYLITAQFRFLSIRCQAKHSLLNTLQSIPGRPPPSKPRWPESSRCSRRPSTPSSWPWHRPSRSAGLWRWRCGAGLEVRWGCRGGALAPPHHTCSDTKPQHPAALTPLKMSHDLPAPSRCQRPRAPQAESAVELFPRLQLAEKNSRISELFLGGWICF